MSSTQMNSPFKSISPWTLSSAMYNKVYTAIEPDVSHMYVNVNPIYMHICETYLIPHLGLRILIWPYAKQSNASDQVLLRLHQNNL